MGLRHRLEQLLDHHAVVVAGVTRVHLDVVIARHGDDLDLSLRRSLLARGVRCEVN